MKKITLKNTLISGLLLLSTLTISAQNLPKAFGRTVKAVNPENGAIRCATLEYEAWLQQQDAKRTTREAFEAWLAPKIAEAKAKRMASKSAQEVQEVLIIPVVVHVIHNGDAVGSNENIPDAQVLSQIEVLNQDFRKLFGTPGYNTNPVGADLEIEFRIAHTAPDGTYTTGIDRVNLNQAAWADETVIDASVKPTTSWNPNNYFNIWTVNFGSSSQLLGYAQFPNTSGLGGLDSYEGASNTDGLVIGYGYFGSADIYPQGNYSTTYPQYTYGRTATHEIGHCFGLLHTSGDNFANCTVDATDSYKDYCPDTPATDQYNYYCNTVNSCPASPGNDMIENYMDYTNDECMNIFTQDQKDRVVAVMNNSIRRASLKTSTTWQVPLTVAEFSLFRNISLYPNPATNVVNIAIQSGELPESFAVYNSIGQLVKEVKVSSNANLSVNTSGLSNGIYFLKVVKGSQSKTLKFIKE
jgi:hypothetical protein